MNEAKRMKELVRRELQQVAREAAALAQAAERRREDAERLLRQLEPEDALVSNASDKPDDALLGLELTKAAVRAKSAMFLAAGAEALSA